MTPAVGARVSPAAVVPAQARFDFPPVQKKAPPAFSVTAFDTLPPTALRLPREIAHPLFVDLSDDPEQSDVVDDVSGSAVAALIKQSRRAVSAGKPELAVALLERALRIEPRNSFVWSALGRAYLKQGSYGNAQAMAMKSNSLARGNGDLRQVNTAVIRAAASAQSAGGSNAGGSLQTVAGRDRVRTTFVSD